jgi:hypothetical protein
VRRSRLLGENAAQVVEGHTVSHGSLDGEVSVAVDEVSAVEPSDGIAHEALSVARLGLELGDPDGLLGPVVDVDDVSLEGLNVSRAVPVGGDVVDPAAAAGAEELLHGLDTGVAVGRGHDGDIGVGVGEGLDQVHVRVHGVGDAHASTAGALTVRGQQVLLRDQLHVDHLPADVRLVDAQDVLGTSIDGALAVGRESTSEHSATIVQHGDKLHTRDAKSRSISCASFPVISPGHLTGASEHGSLVLHVLRETKTTLAGSLTLEGSRRSGRERGEASQGQKEG